MAEIKQETYNAKVAKMRSICALFIGLRLLCDLALRTRFPVAQSHQTLLHISGIGIGWGTGQSDCSLIIP